MNYDPDWDPMNFQPIWQDPSYFGGSLGYGPSLLGEPGDCAPLNIMGRGAPSQACDGAPLPIMLSGAQSPGSPRRLGP